MKLTDQYTKAVSPFELRPVCITNTDSGEEDIPAWEVIKRDGSGIPSVLRTELADTTEPTFTFTVQQECGCACDTTDTQNELTDNMTRTGNEVTWTFTDPFTDVSGYRVEARGTNVNAHELVSLSETSITLRFASSQINHEVFITGTI